jgi:hypothetical protein
MPISFKSLSSVGGGLNRSQTFSSSGTFTVPAGVTSVHAFMRGGNGSSASFGSQNQTFQGSAGTASTFNGVSAVGGAAGVIQAQGQAGSSAIGVGFSPGQGPGLVEFYSVVTPGASMPVTVGSGAGAIVVISWSAA